ncbi:hypothetical protein HJG60_008457 [Phyllostomus discolor]|uniref:Uncharacterized protein n=1 Tax=Phyllostomus discolor TaxID=89673 RepID=A0A833Z079_9CHIR|nr:hypothetical protein HJG60_008457 [Phyllostomus discolor]
MPHGDVTFPTSVCPSITQGSRSSLICSVGLGSMTGSAHLKAFPFPRVRGGVGQAAPPRVSPAGSFRKQTRTGPSSVFQAPFWTWGCNRGQHRQRASSSEIRRPYIKKHNKQIHYMMCRKVMNASAGRGTRRGPGTAGRMGAGLGLAAWAGQPHAASAREQSRGASCPIQNLGRHHSCRGEG